MLGRDETRRRIGAALPGSVPPPDAAGARSLGPADPDPAGGAIFLYFAVTLVQVWLTSRHYDPHPAGAIVVMGAAQYNGVPSPDLAARLNEALIALPRRLRQPDHGHRGQGAG